ncbi:MAG: efflux RND transporter permease subunit [Kiritimatiellae bacterium]|nr:efflux RND transporter permease subunit [Kiritimatiellia bacterium]MDD5522466.1 efflux RND transporter permease subunit [Kiritimatiellia bacterium]
MDERNSIFTRVVESFLKGNLAVLLIIISLLAGVVSLVLTPREEEPQIVVPLADVIVMYPGGSAEEVEKLVSSRLERMLSQIDGVEYVYSMSRPGMAIVTVRFYVGQDRTQSLIKLYNQIFQNIDKTTPGITGWVVKPIEIDDVPIFNATLYSDKYDTHGLYRIAEEVVSKIQHIDNSAKITIAGGEKRVVHVYIDPERLAAYRMSPLEIAGALKMSNVQAESGSFSKGNTEIAVETGPFLRDVKEIKSLMVGVHAGRPVYLRDVAEVRDGPEEPATYTRIGFGPAAAVAGSGHLEGDSFQAVTISLAKKKGSNAVNLAEDAEKMFESLKGKIIPDEVSFRVTRNYGKTADEKVNNLIEGLFEAIITVIVLITIAMNWRVGLIVTAAVPITYALTLLVNMLLGYTINRVTLFALILTLGLLVDDPIVGVENIFRHLSMKKLPRLQAIAFAMNEVLPPIVVATLAIVVAFIPMFFITGMMGPYMRPMAVNVPLAMLSSMIVSLTITPWLSSKLLKDGHGHSEPANIEETKTYRIYKRLVIPFIESRKKAWKLLGVMAALFLMSLGLAGTGLVPLKMLPFDNKNEFQLVIDMPESSTLEATDAVVHEFERYLKIQPEVTEFISTVGSASPMDFNGLVRHYYMRQGPNVADIRVNLLPRKQRKMASHAIALRIRRDIEAIAGKSGAKVKIVEVPPGPPVLSTLVAEIYGQPYHKYDELIAASKLVKDGMAKEKGVVDIDDMVEENQVRLFFKVDREKAALNGISNEDIVQTMRVALGGMAAGIVHVSTEQNELPIMLRLPREKRSDAALLKTIAVKGGMGNPVQIGELGTFEERVTDKTIFHKNQERVVYVTADTAGRGPAYAVLGLQKWFKKHPLPGGIRIDWRGEGEWKITVDVFRDLGIAFAAALVGIYVLLVYQTVSYMLPVIIMLSIPLTMIGIMPGFWILNMLVNRQVGGFDNPVFFTATAMIGMIALAGVVVRNGIILIDFIQNSVDRGVPLRQAIIESGVVRFRPIFLTAGAAMLGAWPITLDPIFSGLAWSLIFGLFVSTAFTLLVIPVVYNMIYEKKKSEAI